jgi:hypothetical protein
MPEAEVKSKRRGRPKKLKKELSNDNSSCPFKLNNISLSKKFAEMGIQWSLCQWLTHLKCMKVPILSILENPKYLHLTNVEKLGLLDKCAKGEEKLQSICQWCLESREIERIFSFCERQQDFISVTDQALSQSQEELFSEKDKKNYLFLVKFKNTAYYHCNWIDYEIAEDVSEKKLKIFWKENRGYSKVCKVFEMKEAINKFKNRESVSVFKTKKAKATSFQQELSEMWKDHWVKIIWKWRQPIFC